MKRCPTENLMVDNVIVLLLVEARQGKCIVKLFFDKKCSSVWINVNSILWFLNYLYVQIRLCLSVCLCLLLTPNSKWRKWHMPLFDRLFRISLASNRKFFSFEHHGHYAPCRGIFSNSIKFSIVIYYSVKFIILLLIYWQT